MTRRALFIASAKTGPELQAGAADCHKLHAVLSQDRYGGFDGALSSPVLTDCITPDAYIAAYMAFLRKSESAHQRLIYFTGHGRVRQSAYGFMFGDDFLPFAAVTALLEGDRKARTLFILDTCHSGAAELGGIKSSELPLADSGSTIFASSRDMQLSHEDEERGSLFTHFLCDCVLTGNGGLPTPGGLISIADAITYVSTRIKAETAVAQTPLFTLRRAEGLPWIARNISGEVRAPSQPARDGDDLDAPCATAAVADLDAELLESCAAERDLGGASTAKQVIEHLDLCTIDGVPSKAAVLCFGRRPVQHFPEAAASFASGDLAGDGVTTRAVDGSILKQLQDLMQLTAAELRTKAYFDGDLREDRLEIPRRVLREVIANALVHRAFEGTGRVQVHVGETAVTISNPGREPRGRSWSDMLERPGLSLTPNRRLANLLQATGGLEGIGRGLSVLQVYRNDHGPAAVTLEQRGEMVVCTLRRKSPTPAGHQVALEDFEQRLTTIILQRGDALGRQRGLFDPVGGDNEPPPLLETQARVRDQILDFVNKPGAQVSVIGAAGAGKTFVLQSIYATLADRDAKSAKSAIESTPRAIPVFISLRTLDTGLPLISGLAHALGLDPALLNHVFERHQLILIADGLDECEPSHRAAVVAALRVAREDTPNLSVVVSSRPDTESLSDSDYIIHIPALGRADVAALVRRISGLQHADILVSRLADQNADLLRNPLLLRLALEVHQDSAELSQDLDHVIAYAFEILWTRQDRTKAGYYRRRRVDLTTDQARSIFGQLSLFIATRGTPRAARDQLTRFLRSVMPVSMSEIGRPGSWDDILIDFAEAGLLIFEGPDVVFAHRTFMEHFALKGLVESGADPRSIAHVAATLIAQAMPVARIVKTLSTWPQLQQQHVSLQEELGAINPVDPSLDEALQRLSAGIREAAKSAGHEAPLFEGLFGAKFER